MRKIENNHPYFEEIFEFSCMVVANISLLMHAAATQTIRELVGFVNEMIKAKSTNVQGKINDHAMMRSIPMHSAGSYEIITLLKTDEIYSYLAGLGKDKPTEIVYSIQAKPTHNPSSSSNDKQGYTTWIGTDPTKRFEILTAYIIGGAFERCKLAFEKKYGKAPSKWPPELQFFRHLRNGCFHSNKFNIRPYRDQPQIDPCNLPKWKAYVMTSDADMNGQKVIGRFFHIHQTIPFLDEMGTLLESQKIKNRSRTRNKQEEV